MPAPRILPTAKRQHPHATHVKDLSLSTTPPSEERRTTGRIDNEGGALFRKTGFAVILGSIRIVLENNTLPGSGAMEFRADT